MPFDQAATTERAQRPTARAPAREGGAPVHHGNTWSKGQGNNLEASGHQSPGRSSRFEFQERCPANAVHDSPGGNAPRLERRIAQHHVRRPTRCSGNISTTCNATYFNHFCWNPSGARKRPLYTLIDAGGPRTARSPSRFIVPQEHAPRRLTVSWSRNSEVDLDGRCGTPCVSCGPAWNAISPDYLLEWRSPDENHTLVIGHVHPATGLPSAEADNDSRSRP